MAGHVTRPKSSACPSSAKYRCTCRFVPLPMPARLSSTASRTARMPRSTVPSAPRSASSFRVLSPLPEEVLQLWFNQCSHAFVAFPRVELRVKAPPPERRRPCDVSPPDEGLDEFP